MGCSSSSTSGPPAPPDPGGTFGAEILVHVVGAGRVTSAPVSVDCPQACFQKFLFDSSTKNSQIALTAQPTTNWKFTGWTFNKTTSGTRGRGSDDCQPLTRATNDAPGGADLSAPTIALASGETQGTPPKGKEGACGATGNVPLAYDLTATFVPLPALPDAGPDAADAGDAGPVDPPLFDAPVTGAKGGKIFVRSSRVYWQWSASGQSAISMGFTTGGSRTDLFGLGGQLTAFNVTTSSVLYQTSAQTFVSIPLGGGTPFPLPGAPACSAISGDSSYAYCRSGGSIYRWYLFGVTNDGGTPPQWASGLATGNDLAVDFSNFYYSDPFNGTVNAIPLSGGIDGGTPAILSIATGQLSPSETQISSSTVFWTTFDNGSTNGTVSSASRFGGGITTSLASKPFVKTFTVDTSSGYVWFTSVPSSNPGASSIWRVSTSGGVPTLFRQNLTDVGGVATDTSYVYWTAGDGRVYRALKQ
jgi:hypothetical protein